jgi:hypothetical protein
VARGQGASGQKASAHWISDFELRISDFEFFFFNPHSAINNPQFLWPAWSMKWKPPHGFCPEGPCPRAWHQRKKPFTFGMKNAYDSMKVERR